MDSNEKMWDSIKVLMEQSFWGKSASIDSLSHDLRSEVQEFIRASQNRDSLNALEEAADVLMMTLCMLYRVADREDGIMDDIIERITEKLHWRYGHLYQNEYLGEEENELEKWEQAKKIEHKMNLMFCVNKNCIGFRKAGLENITYDGERYWCNLCKNEINPSSNTVLLYRDRKANRYMKCICNSIVAYSEGKDNAAIALSIDYPEAFRALCKQLLNDKDDGNTVLPVFIDYIHRKYCIEPREIEKYLDKVRGIQNQMKTENLIEKYYKQICSEDYCAKSIFKPHEWEKIAKYIMNQTFDVSKSIERTSYFHAMNWDNQVVHKYLLHYPNRKSKMIIECMTLIHYQGSKVRDLTIELSNMYKCMVRCRFCASGALPGNVQYLEALDYVKQLNSCLALSGIDPNDFENFYVSFAGIGEPSVLYKNICAGMAIMHDLYPRIKFNIATFGYKKECFSYWSKLNFPIRTLQIPLYHTDRERLKTIVSGIPEEYEFSHIITEAINYKKSHALCRVKINYIPMKEINDSNTDIQQFVDIIQPFKDDISVKISFLNYTRPAEENGFFSSGIERMKEIKSIFDSYGFNTYLFGSDKNTALGCGQLAQDNISGDI